jgi:hypothetical protein
VALTPQNNEAFLREVDEELRRDQALDLWRRYGRLMIAGVVLALAALAGFLFWQHRQAQAAEKQGETLQTAYDALSSGDNKAASAPLAQLATSDRAGYRVLATFTQADIMLQGDDLKGAAAKFASIASDASVSQPFRDLALIRQTSAEYDSLKPDVVISRLLGLTVPGNAWAGSAGELVATAYLRQGRADLAQQTFARIAADETVPPSLRQRAVQMAGVLEAGATAGNGKPAANKDVTKQ